MANITQMRHGDTSLDYLKVHNESKNAVMLLHGYGASQNDLLGLHSVLDPGATTDWYFPNGPQSVPISPFMEGRAWFGITSSKIQEAAMRGEHISFADACPEDFLDSLEKLKSFTIELQKNYEQVYIGGFSQGAMICAHIASQLDNLAGLVLYSGVLIAKEEFLKNHNKKPLSFYQSHGVQDPVLGVSQARELNTFLNEIGFSGDLQEFPGQHEIPMDVIEKSKLYLNLK